MNREIHAPSDYYDPDFNNWKEWYAWYPVKMDDTDKWLWRNKIERLYLFTTLGGEICSYYIYRKIGNTSFSFYELNQD